MSDGEVAAVFHDFSLQAADGSQVAPSYAGVLAERGFLPVVALKGCSIAVTRGFIDTWDWPPRSSPVSHDFWVTLLATAFGQRRILPDILIDHRIHDRNTSGWIPDQNSREFTRSGDGASDIDLLVDLVVKPPRVRGLTATFLDVVRERGESVDPAAAQRLAGACGPTVGTIASGAGPGPSRAGAAVGSWTPWSRPGRPASRGGRRARVGRTAPVPRGSSAAGPAGRRR